MYICGGRHRQLDDFDRVSGRGGVRGRKVAVGGTVAVVRNGGLWNVLVCSGAQAICILHDRTTDY